MKQDVKYFLRAIGNPAYSTPGAPILSGNDAEVEIGYKYLSQGWRILSVHHVGSIRNEKGEDIAYTFMHILVKDEIEPAVVGGSEEKASKTKDK